MKILGLPGVKLVIAKSLGALVTTYAFEKFNFKPQKAVLIGTPIKRQDANNAELLSNFVNSVPTLFIQQTSDFNGSFSELTEVVQSFPNGRIVEAPGDDHIYGNTDELQQIIQPFC